MNYEDQNAFAVEGFNLSFALRLSNGNEVGGVVISPTLISLSQPRSFAGAFVSAQTRCWCNGFEGGGLLLYQLQEFISLRDALSRLRNRDNVAFELKPFDPNLTVHFGWSDSGKDVRIQGGLPKEPPEQMFDQDSMSFRHVVHLQYHLEFYLATEMLAEPISVLDAFLATCKKRLGLDE